MDKTSNSNNSSASSPSSSAKESITVISPGAVTTTTTPTVITTSGPTAPATTFIIHVGDQKSPVKLFPTTNILHGALLGEKGGGIMMQPYPHYEDDNPVLSKYSTEGLRDSLFQKFITRHGPPTEGEEAFKRKSTFLRDILFDFILHVPIVIDGYSVKRKNWAKAFYESDVIQSAKCLFEDLFSQEEMSTCTLNGKAGTKELSAIKMLAILRASCWMKNKNQDPYSFNPADPSHNVHPTKDEQDKIEKKVFTERRSQANRKITKKKPPNNFDSLAMKRSPREPDSDSQHSEIMGDNQDSGSIQSEGSLNDIPISKAFEEQSSQEQMGDLEQLYYRFPDDFLDVFVPNRKDIFIDGLLIPRDVWSTAFIEAKKDTIKAAWILFKNLFSEIEIMKCTLNGKNNTIELCPVRKLAIIRAVQWMSKSNLDGDQAFEFDSDDEKCNLFPTEEDKERIETKVFTEKRYQQSRQLTSKNTGILMGVK